MAGSSPTTTEAAVVETRITMPEKSSTRRVNRKLVILSIFITAAANFGVQYNYDSIKAAQIWIHAEYGENEHLDSLQDNMIFVGTVVGMLGFGIGGDLFGRDAGLALCGVIQGLAALLTGLAPWGDGNVRSAILIAFRGLIGIGAGGTYPLTAAKAAEDCSHSDPTSKATAAAWAFFWRNPGAMAVYVNVLIMYFTIGHDVDAHGTNSTDLGDTTSTGMDWSWRYILMFGAVAPLCYTIGIVLSKKPDSCVEEADPDKCCKPESTSALLSSIWHEPGVWYNFLGTAGGWFFFDITWYGNDLLKPKVIDMILSSPDVDVQAYSNLAVDAVGIVFTLGIIPFLPHTGVRWMQVIGFALTAILALVLGFAWPELVTDPFDGSKYVLLVLYGLIYGTWWITNVTTYVMPALVYKPSIRSTLGGASAAAGKIGAITGSTAFKAMLDSCSSDTECERDQMSRVMFICFGFAIAGLLCTVIGNGVEHGDRCLRFRREAGKEACRGEGASSARAQPQAPSVRVSEISSA